jgi:hypothetical protein
MFVRSSRSPSFHCCVELRILSSPYSGGGKGDQAKGKGVIEKEAIKLVLDYLPVDKTSPR